MLFDIYVILLLFVTGLVFGLLAILIGLKRPLKLKRIGSYCLNCNEQYEWYQLIPVVSFFFAKGKRSYSFSAGELCASSRSTFSGVIK